ncbi:ankyrin repeat domain-containing protein [Plantactinospora sp. S1510]|uniref:Ankyrin repeat domain-containing protein n=1 Tax=Plantactinospora alkalitolerans TaxID=2789879 RepID=A0ABS0GRJ4_9ACTN|nr:ankyrin repeat domain-containing protein [Plantactinospora alkalitolerans]MBF9128816.1 ankyrin repeat domain-containing protein [Plantactinospora alkalitolerans]
MADDDGWSMMDWRSWSELVEVRARLAAGADPDGDVRGQGGPLHVAAERGSADVVAELAGLVEDVDAEHDGRTALWIAVQADKPENARALVAAGADPWRPMMAGWSPGRLSLASRTPDLFPVPPGVPGLSPAESAAATEAHRLLDALGDFYYDGLSLCCVAGIDAAEAVRRLDATVIETDDPVSILENLSDRSLDEDALLTVGVTDVPGGCVVSQPWAYGASTPVVAQRLSTGTVCYAMYANPKSGNQGSIGRNGVIEGWDLHPGGGWSGADESADEILRTYLFRYRAIAYCCAYAGLRLTDARPVTGPPDRWVELPSGDYWS